MTERQANASSHRILVGCEVSGRVRDALIRRGYDATSCDLLPSESPGPHIQGDVRDHLNDGWSEALLFPVCTKLCRAGARWWSLPGWAEEQAEALDFVRCLMGAPIPRIAIENPPGKIGTAIRPADQYIQPWQFGHPEVKMTGLWLKNLPKLVPTKIVEGRSPRVHYEAPGPDRWLRRSRTLPGIADAMAEQWGCLA